MQLGFHGISCSFLPTISLDPTNLQFTKNDINPVFGEACSQLFSSHFSPLTIFPKTIFGKQLTGHDLAERLKVYEEIFGNTRIPTVQDALEKELEFIGQEFTATLINHYKKATLQRLHNHKNVPEEEIRELHFSLRQRLVSDLRHHEVLIRKPKLLNEATKILYYESSEYLDRTLQARRFYHALEQIKNNEQKMQSLMASQMNKYAQKGIVAMAKDDSGSFLDTVLQPIIPFISLGAAFLLLYILYWIISCLHKIRSRKQTAASL
ncbi:uncharacterized protein LOC129599986 isoform X1 [Paramacrobiotus metropolitanus]|uniref:uncharacterized protein LOC129599986 isoform X1 n=1 Tax=Paramacrobiotus metropolitanus TaxID=2943436 RepID=UPI002445856A|nr:uncharacterized protein LOC129599986 isoform X1 [Paramacrobiotus metropolitanus]